MKQRWTWVRRYLIFTAIRQSVREILALRMRKRRPDDYLCEVIHVNIPQPEEIYLGKLRILNSEEKYIFI